MNDPLTDPSGIARPIRSWFRRHRRALPWRGAGPWPVLVSEVMLQQTPVARVRPVYEAWMTRWPTPACLAAASPGEVLTAWGRLGYPRRARALHRAAAAIVARHGGAVPADVDALLALPGVGEYTARAVAAFGFGQRHGVVDVNVRRVLARALLGVADAAPARSHIALAESLLPAKPAAAAETAAALMELGALVCRPTAPACDVCPIAAGCRWRAAGRPPGAHGPRRQAGYEGSDRQARGRLLAVLRAGGRLDPAAAAAAVPDARQRRRAITGLVTDGLIVAAGSGWEFPAALTGSG